MGTTEKIGYSKHPKGEEVARTGSQEDETAGDEIESTSVIIGSSRTMRNQRQEID